MGGGQEDGWCWLHNGKYWQSFDDVDYTAVQPFTLKYYFGKGRNFIDQLREKRKKEKKSSLTIVTPELFWKKLLGGEPK